MDAEEPDEPLLLVGIEAVLFAFMAVQPYASTSGTPKERMTAQREMALDLLDWATCESDRGRELAALKAAAGYKPKGGTMFIGPFDLG